MNNKMISPSMMCANIFGLKETIDIFEKKKIEYLHIDVMDGLFVPNFALGTDYCKQLRDKTSINLDIHLMVENPEKCIEWLDLRKDDIVSIHIETTNHIQKVLSNIKSYGAKAFVAINPGTSINVLDDILDDIDGVLLMCVNPGFAGQKMVPHSIEKCKKLKEYLINNHKDKVLIEVDGNISFENAKKTSDAGANIFVGGTSSIFNKNINDNIDMLRNSIN